MDNRRKTTRYFLRSEVTLCNMPTVMGQALSLDMIRGGLIVSWTFQMLPCGCYRGPVLSS
jgi:hypothetical protein